jgi:hypothetical protein
LLQTSFGLENLGTIFQRTAESISQRDCAAGMRAQSDQKENKHMHTANSARGDELDTSMSQRRRDGSYELGRQFE